MSKRLLTITRVYKQYDGSPVGNSTSITALDPADGGRLKLQAVTDDFGSKGGHAIIDPLLMRDGGADELIEYGGTDEVTDELVGVVRAAPVSHIRDAFVMAVEADLDSDGTPIWRPSTDKLASGYFDDENKIAEDIPILPHLWPYFSLGVRTESAETVWVGTLDDEDDQEYVLTAPIGRSPRFDDDLEVLPAQVIAPTPPVDELPPSGVTPDSPVMDSSSLAWHSEFLPDGTKLFYLDINWAFSGQRADGRDLFSWAFKIDVFDGASLLYSSASLGEAISIQVKPGRTYTVYVYAWSNGVYSDPARRQIAVGSDTAVPSVPGNLTAVGGVGGGGAGVVNLSWDRNTEVNFDHYEVYAGTRDIPMNRDGTITSPSLYLVDATRSNNSAIVKAYNGTSLQTFDYNATLYMRVVAVSRSGVASLPSSLKKASASQAISADVLDLYSKDYFAANGSVSGKGWAIFKNGDAQFYNGYFRGNIVGATFTSVASRMGNIVLDGPNSRIRVQSPDAGGNLVDTFILDGHDVTGPYMLLGSSSRGVYLKTTIPGGDLSKAYGQIVIGPTNKNAGDQNAIVLEAASSTIFLGDKVKLTGSGNGQIVVGDKIIIDGANGGSLTMKQGIIVASTYKTDDTGPRIVFRENSDERPVMKVYGGTDSAPNLVGKLRPYGGDMLLEAPQHGYGNGRGWMRVSDDDSGQVKTGDLRTEGLVVNTYRNSGSDDQPPSGWVRLARTVSSGHSRLSIRAQGVWLDVCVKDPSVALPAGVVVNLD